MNVTFSEVEIDMVNVELAVLADIERLDRVEDQYDEMVEAMCSEHDMMMYACHSYDEDCVYYGEMQ